jgi:transketolase
LADGKDAILFGYGPVMLHEALLAAEYLRKIDFGLKIVNMPWLNKIDSNWLKNLVKNYDKIYVLEDHSTYGGLGDRILNSLVESDSINNKSFEKFGLNDYPECGTPLEVLEYHKLDGKSLAQRISGIENIDVHKERIRQKYTAEAPQ